MSKENGIFLKKMFKDEAQAGGDISRVRKDTFRTNFDFIFFYF